MNHWVEIKQTDKKSYTVSSVMLEALLKKSAKLEKAPLLKILINKNKKEMFELTCNIKVLAT